LSILFGPLGIISYILIAREGKLDDTSEGYNAKNKRYSLIAVAIAIMLLFLPFQTYDNKIGVQLIFTTGYIEIRAYTLSLAVGLICCLKVNKIAIRNTILAAIPILGLTLFDPILSRITSYAPGLVLTMAIFLPMYFIAAAPFIQKKRRVK
jgi:hypothetical protein